MSSGGARVVNIASGPLYGVIHYDVYIGRPSIWGNPFRIGVDGDRTEVLSKYRAWISSNNRLLPQLPDLREKILGCYCSPLPCHGDILIELLEGKT